MKIRLILLSIAGLAAYVALANFNSKIIRETEIPKERNQISAHQVQAEKHGADASATAAPATRRHQAPAPCQLKVQAPMEHPQTPADEKTQQPQDESARKDQRIKQLLDVQETIVARQHPQQAEVASGAESPAKQLEELTKQIKALTAEKGQITAELNQTKAQIEQLRQELNQQQKQATETAGRMQKEQEDRLAAMAIAQEKNEDELKGAQDELAQMQQKLAAMQTAGSQNDQAAKEKEAALAEAQRQLQSQIAAANQFKAQIEQLRQELNQQQKLATAQEKNAAELKGAQDELAQLQQKLAAMQTVDAQRAQAAKEKEAELTKAQQQLQNQIKAADQVKAQLAETMDQLTATKKDLEQTERKGAEEAQQANALGEQKKVVEQALAEKKEALDKAVLTIQSLRQEVGSQPQAVATVQGLLDERSREFDRMSKESAARIEQLNQQIAPLTKDKDKAVKELERCAAELENSRKGAMEFEAALAKMRAAQREAEQNRTAAMESKEALQTQLTEKVAALGKTQAKIDELTAATTSLHNEKIGLASQLQDLLADHNNLLTMKNSFEAQAAALTQAEGKLKEMTALQAQNEQLTKSLTEKDTALEHAAKQTQTLTALQARLGEMAKQAETGDATLKQLEQEKSNLASQLAAAQALTQDIDSLKKALDEKSNALTLAETKAKGLDNLKEQIAAVEAKATAAQTAQVAAEKKVAESEAAAKRCNESLATADGTAKRLEGELGEAQNRIKELTDKHQLQAQQDLVPTLNQQIATLRSQLDATMAAAEVKSDEMREVNKKTQILQTERDGLQQELTSTQALISDLQKQLEAVKGPARPTAAGTQAPPADQQAAGADSDKDGILDQADLCPNTPAGVPVNGLGCPQGKAIILEGLVFSSGTATLTPGSQKKLDRIAAALASTPHTKLEVAGYTDNVGEAKRNQRLSTQRAQAVSVYLTSKGVAASRLQTKGYGAENPIGDNATAEGRQQNRRIELHVIAP
ncbi:MAG: OmpA family protein [Proteobacteria bacterium]|nr:OmpA family protein [Pseudomonadota bacterium]